MAMPAPGILQSDLDQERAAAEEAAKQAQYDYMLNSGDHFLPQHLGLPPKSISQGEDLQDDGSGIGVPKQPGAQDPNISVPPVVPPNTPQPKPPTTSSGTDATNNPSSTHTQSQSDGDSGDTLYVSQGDKERLVKANKKTIKDLEDALRDANDSLNKAEALKVADKSKSGSMSNMFNGPPAGTNIKQHTIGLILPANTEFYNLPPSGINANTYFANLFGQTIQSPLSIVAGPAQNPPLQSVQSY